MVSDFVVVLQPNWGLGCLVFEVYRSNKIRHTHTSSTAPLKGWSARRRGCYVHTHNKHKGQTFTTSAGFEPVISTIQRSKTCALDRTSPGIGDVRNEGTSEAEPGTGYERPEAE